MRRIVLFAIILILIIPIFTLAVKGYEDEDIILNILSSVEGEFLEGDINLGGILLDKFIAREEMELIINELGRKLDLLENEINPLERIPQEDRKYLTREIVSHDGFNQLSIYGQDVNENPISLIMSSYIIPGIENGETALFINMTKNEQNYKINDIIEDVEKLFKEYGKSVDITTCVIGTIKGKVDNNLLDKRIFKAIKKSKGRIIEEYRDPDILSYMIYTPFIESSIFSGEKKVNLNLAIRYNEYEDRTYIWIGTPIITTGY